MHVFLDLWGVLVDSEKATRQYRVRLADLMGQRFGGSRDLWLKAHDQARSAYDERIRTATWNSGSWAEVAGQLDADHFLDVLRLAGTAWRPDDPAAFARDFEAEVLVGIDARYPDARSALERLRKRGHGVYVATQATEANARAALKGAQLESLIDRLFTGSSQDSPKTRGEYWRTLPAAVGSRADRCVIVDDRVEYLEPAAEVGFVALLLDREGTMDQERVPPFIEAILRDLAGLPHFIDTLGRRGGR